MTTIKKIIILLMIAFVTGIVFGKNIKRKHIKIMNFKTKETICLPLPYRSPDIDIYISGDKYDINIKK